MIALALAAFAAPAAGADGLVLSPPDTWVYSAPGAFTSGYVEVEFRGTEGSTDDTHTANPVDHLECRLDAGPWTRCDGPWVLTDVPEGQHEIQGRAVDTTGLADPTPAAVDFYSDRTGPFGEVSIDDGATVTGRYLVRLQTSATDVTRPQELRVSNSPAVDGNGVLSEARQYQLPFLGTGLDWSLDDPDAGGSHVPGPHSVYVQYQDSVFNWGPIAQASINLDPGQQPTVLIRLSASQNPAPIGGRVDVRAYAEVGDGSSITDGELQLDLYVPGSATLMNSALGGQATTNGAWITTSALPPGTYRAVATFGASADLPDAQVTIEVKIGPAKDTVPPNVGFGLPTPIVDDDTPSFSLPVGSEPIEATSFQCRFDGGPWTACGPDYEVSGYGQGWHEAEVRGVDRAGNWSEPGHFWFHHGPRPDGWATSPSPPDIKNPVVTVDEYPPAGATGFRMSNSVAIDGNGRLVLGEDLGLPHTQMVDWDLTDPAYGGTSADGWKTAYLEWSLPDGSWTELYPFSLHLDRTPPSLSLSIEQGSAFADQDHLFVLAQTDGGAAISIADSPDTLLPPYGDMSNSGLTFLTWPITDVPVGSVVTVHLYGVAVDDAGNRSPVVEASIVIDRSSPMSAFARPAFVVGGRVSTSYVPIRLIATSTDTGSGVGTSYLQQMSGSVGRTVATAHSASVSITASVGYASTRYWRTWAVDRLGHRGALVLGPAVRPVLLEETSSSITYHGRWTRTYVASALGHEVMRTTALGATATFTMTGRAAAIVAQLGPGRGKCAVFVDGLYMRTIDLGTSTSQPATIVFATSWSRSATHRIKVEALGTHGRPAVDLDAVLALP
ncbi:MAG TPA: hypothetical protein VKR24_11420 [Candidatus Limnocylindrales bacterium]|nr:hypothetical protein [Candidatus Limnocylindrales bacterium]